MRSDFEQLDANASAGRRTGESSWRPRLGRRSLSTAVGLGLALVGIGGYRATLPTQAADPGPPTISTDELMQRAGDVPMSGAFDPH